MAQAATNNAGVRVSLEETIAGYADTGSAWGAAPFSGTVAPYSTEILDPDLQELRYTSHSLGMNKSTVVSETIRQDRQRDFLAEVAASNGGDINYEFAFGTEFEILLQCAMFNNFVVATTGAPSSITATAATPVAGQTRLTRTGDFTAGGFTKGAWVRAAGMGSGDGVYEVATVGTTIMDVYDPNNVLGTSDGDGTGDEVVTQKMIRNGVTQKSMLIEAAYTDIDRYVSFVGCRVGQMQMNATVQQILNGSFSVQGSAVYPSTVTALGTGTLIASGTTQQLNATSNVGHIRTAGPGGAALTTAIRSAQITVANNLRTIDAIGNKFPLGINPGFVDVTGTLEIYFEDLDIYNDFVNHTKYAFSMRFTDLAGNVLVVTLPRIFASNGNPVVGGGNQDVILSTEFTAIRNDDATVDTTVQYDLLAV